MTTRDWFRNCDRVSSMESPSGGGRRNRDAGGLVVAQHVRRGLIATALAGRRRLRSHRGIDRTRGWQHGRHAGHGAGCGDAREDPGASFSVGNSC